jgi:hypothetical protein
MIDAPDRSPPRFPPDKEPLAAAAIDKLLDELGAVTTDVAISSGACGGDLLFAESCLQRRLRVEIYLPFVQEEFLKESIDFAGEHWREKFFWVKERTRRWHIMPQELRPTPPGEDSFACGNLWMLDKALAYGARKVSFICLWDRQAGDGPGWDEAFTRRRCPGFRQGPTCSIRQNSAKPLAIIRLLRRMTY